MKPIQSSPSVSTSTPAQTNRGWHAWRQAFTFPSGATQAELDTFTAGFQAGQGSSYMWCHAHPVPNPMGVPDGAVTVEFSFGYDSGD